MGVYIGGRAQLCVSLWWTYDTIQCREQLEDKSHDEQDETVHDQRKGSIRRRLTPRTALRSTKCGTQDEEVPDIPGPLLDIIIERIGIALLESSQPGQLSVRKNGTTVSPVRECTSGDATAWDPSSGHVSLWHSARRRASLVRVLVGTLITRDICINDACYYEVACVLLERVFCLVHAARLSDVCPHARPETGVR